MMSDALAESGTKRPGGGLLIRALCLGLLTAAVAALISWWLVPVEYTAKACLRTQEPTGVRMCLPGTFGQVSRQATARLTRMPFVLREAVRDPELVDLPIIAGSEDPVGWLRDNLEVRMIGETNILEIALRGDDPAQLRKIVQAVARAYVREVDRRDRDAEERRFSALHSVYVKTRAEIEQREVTAGSGGGESRAGDVEVAEENPSANRASDYWTPEDDDLARLKRLATSIEREMNDIGTRLAAILLDAPTPVTADVERRKRIVHWIALAAFGLPFVLTMTAGYAARRARTRAVFEPELR